MKELEELLYKYLDKGLVQLIISNPRTQAEAVNQSPSGVAKRKIDFSGKRPTR